MRSYDICTLSTGELDQETNAPAIRATVSVTGFTGDDEHFGDVPSFGSLGVTALPAPMDKGSRCEGLILRNVEGVDAVLVGARDTRSSSVYANLKPGDTALHATDKEAAAQFQAKANRQAIAVTKDSAGDTMLVNLDGKNDKVQIAAFGGIIEMDKATKSISMTTPSGKASILMQDDTIYLIGRIMLGGKQPVSQFLYTTVPGTPITGTAGAGAASAGVFYAV